jgi:hypothetical protein
MAEDRIAIPHGRAFAAPEITQFHETTLLTRVSGRTVPVTFGVVPARSLDERRRRRVGSLHGLLGIVDDTDAMSIPLPQMGALTIAVALILDPELNERAPGEVHPVWQELRYDVERWPDQTGFYPPPWWRHPRNGDDSPLAVAETLVYSTVPPFESSPLSGQSLSTIVTGSGGGALVAAVIGGVATPWLLVAVPAGVVLMKVADGVGDALQEVVKHKIIGWLAPELHERGK